MKRIFLFIIVFTTILCNVSTAQNYRNITKEDLTGKGITVLIFLKEECPICQKYAPILRKITQEFGSDSVHFFGIFPDKSPNTKNIEDFVRKYSISFPIILDTTLEFTRFCEAKITPEVFVYDTFGHMRYSGRIDDWFVSFGKKQTAAKKHNLKEALRALILNKPVEFEKTDAVGCYITLN